jgi:hypothetical protein
MGKRQYLEKKTEANLKALDHLKPAATYSLRSKKNIVFLF